MRTAEFEAIYAKHVRAVLAYCLRRTGSAEAHDATAEVFVVAWRRLSELRDAPDLLPWLYGVAANVLRNQSRSRRRALKLVAKIGSQPQQHELDPGTLIVYRSDHGEVQKAVDSLKPKYREVIKLVEWEELPRAKVAEVLEISRATVDQRMHRAYRHLERLLHDMSDEPLELGGGRP